MFENFKFPLFKKRSESIKKVDLETGEITEETREIVGERSLPSVNKGMSFQGRITNVLTVIFIICFTIFFLWRYYAGFMHSRELRESTKKKDRTHQAAVTVPPLVKNQLPSELASLIPEPPPPPPPLPAPLTQATASDLSLAPRPNLHSSANEQRPLTPDELAIERKKTAPVVFKFVSGSESGYTAAISQNSSSEDNTRRDKLAEALKPTYAAGVKAALIPDPDMFITKGTMLDCVLDPAINSSQPGMIVCFLSRDVRSASNRVILLDKGTKLTGEYQGDPKGSDARIFILWATAETPNHVIIDLNSPGTDALGRAGINGYVDTHFMDRFGAAILVSVMGDVISDATNKKAVQGNNNSVSFPTTTQSAQNLASEILKQQANIPNTLNQNQAAHINVYVARHLDFRGVYSLESK